MILGSSDDTALATQSRAPQRSSTKFRCSHRSWGLASAGLSATACAASFINFSFEINDAEVGNGQLTLETFDTVYTCSMAPFEAMGALLEIIE
jgi:hypothetical protein